MKILILGMGNPVLADDAIGVRLAKDFKARLNRLATSSHVFFVEECSVGGINLLDVVAGYDRLIILDSIKTQGGIPGHWYTFSAGSLRQTMNLSNIHDTNFATALELGRRLGQKIPPEDQIQVFAIEVEDNATFSESMTPSLEAAYPIISEEIFQKVLPLIQTK
jgi:hydrogenase maturation protease